MLGIIEDFKNLKELKMWGHNISKLRYMFNIVLAAKTGELWKRSEKSETKQKQC